ncbi:MAG: hypothetical protein KJ889_09745 [Gammaproteobacteria bacterium]|nr:hypothetical protein [Gammaproteobacteria bacterium]
MANLVRNLTIALAFTSIVAGLFLFKLLALLGVSASSSTEVRWVLILGMPVLLAVSFFRLNLTPAQSGASVALYSLAQFAIFLAPFGWLARHALA